MKILKIKEQTSIKINNIKGFLKRNVVVSGTSAKVNCPKEYLGSEAILVILDDEPKKKSRRTRKISKEARRNNPKAS
jgi:putative transposon-encoded protein